MTDTIIMQGPGYTIAKVDDAETAVPYGPVDRPNSGRNHGFIDLRDRPEAAAFIPEAQNSEGMQAILRAVNARGFRFMSLGCERAIFPRQDAKAGEPTFLCGSYVQVAYRESVLNRDQDRFVALAQKILSGTAPSREHHIGFEMLVEPLRFFFGDGGCYTLVIKPMGYGNSETAAIAAWEHAAEAVAAVFVELQGQQFRPPT